MKYITKRFITVLCIIIAAILAFNKIEGWGWFLFVAITIHF